MTFVVLPQKNWSFDCTNNDILERHFDTSTIREVVSGGAVGVDQSGERWARAHGIKVTEFKPDWSEGKRGGAAIAIRRKHPDEPRGLCGVHVQVGHILALVSVRDVPRLGKKSEFRVLPKELIRLVKDTLG